MNAVHARNRVQRSSAQLNVSKSAPGLDTCTCSPGGSLQPAVIRPTAQFSDRYKIKIPEIPKDKQIGTLVSPSSFWVF